MTKNSTKLLLVDDDVDYLFQKKIELEQCGFEIDLAHSAQEAMEIIEKKEVEPDVAIVDMMMEEKDAGIVLSYQLKKIRPKMPVIMVTGVTGETGIEFDVVTDKEKQWIKADSILTKPIRVEQLEREIRRLLANE